MTDHERIEIIRQRRALGFPIHAPPHFAVTGEYLITSACYQHEPIFHGNESLSLITHKALTYFHAAEVNVIAWVFMPNHYHVLLTITDMARFSEVLRKFHSAIATILNRKHKTLGRRVWYRFMDRKMRSDRHFAVSINYIHHNPVKHGYVARPQDWPWSSWHEYSETKGTQYLEKLIVDYPLYDYGRGWDE